MVPQTLTYRPRLANSFFTKALILKLDALVRRVSPRPHVLSSGGLILVGLGIPVLMLLELIPVTLFLGFVGMSLITVGGLVLLCNL